jgi:hypothetical protein
MTDQKGNSALNEVAQLLGFHFNAGQFAAQAVHIFSPETRRNLELAIKGLDEISKENNGFEVKTPPDVGAIYRTFMQLAPQGIETLRRDFNTSRKARKLVWSLHYSEDGLPSIISSEFLTFALQLIDDHWRYSMLPGIFDTLLQNWNHPNAKLLRSFITKKITDYAQSRPSVLSIRKNERFYTNDNGATLLGAHLIGNRQKLLEVWQQLDLPDHMKGYTYFADVATAFTQTAMRTPQFTQHVLDIIEFLRLHNIRDTSKKCLCKIILKLQDSNNLELRDQVKSGALHLIGDPANDPDWMPWERANERGKEEIKEAQRILNEWLTQQFIDIFFEKSAEDKERKNFWMKYSKHISKFKIYGNSSLKSRLANDNRIKPFLDARFGLIQNAEGDRALAMQIRDKGYVLVEFIGKNKGAFYAYKSSNPICPDISKYFKGFITH